VTLSVPHNFNFWRTVYSHGWCSLPPFLVDKETRTLRIVFDVGPGDPAGVEVCQPRRGILAIKAQRGTLSSPGKRRLLEGLRTVLRLDEDLSEFYAQARRHGRFRWVSRMGAGRLLRAPTVFEDVVKMICTTNCSWALTETMVNRLCAKLGRSEGVHTDTRHDFRLHSPHVRPLKDFGPQAGFAFPQPEAVADCSEKFLRKEIHAGYRAPYLLQLSRRVVKGQLDLESWRTVDAPTEELYKEVSSVKGVGPYAAGNILKLLGRYDYLAIDSWCRKTFFEIHKNGRRTNDRIIERFYEPFGKWKGLFFWMDLTKSWYEHDVPF